MHILSVNSNYLSFGNKFSISGYSLNINYIITGTIGGCEFNLHLSMVIGSDKRVPEKSIPEIRYPAFYGSLIRIIPVKRMMEAVL